MKNSIKLAIHITVFTLGIFGFIHGFFLTRRQFEEISQCDVTSLVSGLPSAFFNANIESSDADGLKHELHLFHSIELNRSTSGVNSAYSINNHFVRTPIKKGCWSAQRYERAFLFIVDALRLDFMTASVLENAHEDKGIATMMPLMHELLKSNATQTRFFGFRADPPTVTAQRLKGMTTGSMPTFVDVGSNVASAAITEDNWIDQFKRARPIQRNIFLGDDTWHALFPEQFDHAQPFDSFDTRDLDSVDQGIERELWPLLTGSGADTGDRNVSWGLFIVHFLGVDHIGHTHSASHPLMDARVRQMDRLMRAVVEALPEDALFLLMGDHGMTDDGDHGGATTKETDSGLFVYSKRPFGGDPNKRWNSTLHAWEEGNLLEHRFQEPRIVAQVDLVSTISLLLGLPIPYSNLGGIVPELFVRSNNWNELAEAWLVNSLQVMRYLRDYGFPAQSLAALSKQLSSAMKWHSQARVATDETACASAQRAALSAYSLFLQQSLELGRRHFTTFDERSMLLGVALMLTAAGAAAWTLKTYIRRSDLASDVPYVTGVWLCAVVHACAGFSDNGIALEPGAHAVSVILLAMLFLWSRSQTLKVRQWLASLLPIFAAVAVWLSSPYMSPWVSAGLYASSCVIWTRLLLAYCVPGRAGRITVHVFAGSVALGAVQNFALHWQKTCFHAFLSVLWAARLSMLLASVGVCISAIHYRIMLHSNRTLACMWLFHLGAHICALLSIITGPLLLPVLLCFGMHAVAFKPFAPRSPTTPIQLATHTVHAAMLLRAAFFCTGHRLSFEALHLGAGLVGAAAFNHYWAGALLLLNTFGLDSFGLGLALSGLDLFWQNFDFDKSSRDVTLPKSSFLCHCTQAFVVYRMFVVLCSTICALLLRRHLMVWAVFAPKLSFECAFWILQAVVTLLCLR